VIFHIPGDLFGVDARIFHFHFDRNIDRMRGFSHCKAVGSACEAGPRRLFRKATRYAFERKRGAALAKPGCEVGCQDLVIPPSAIARL
jgi:hypothetical protein